MVLVHDDWNLWVQFRRGDHQVTKVGVLGVSTSATRSLDDDRRIGFISSFHDRLDLLHVVDVERRNAVIVFGGVIQDNAKWDEWHGVQFLRSRVFLVGKIAIISVNLHFARA